MYRFPLHNCDLTVVCWYRQVAPHGAVSCDDKRCSKIGARIMEENGGSAVDAAVAAMFCLSVVQPESSGLGGYRADSVLFQVVII